jgi:hypothetical protein
MWMSLKTHNMPSGRMKKRLWLSRWNDFPFEFILCIRGFEKRDFFESLKLCSSYLYDLWQNTLPCGRVLKRLCWRPWSDVSRCQKEIRNNFCIQGIEKSLWSKSFKSCLSRRMAMGNHNLHSGRIKNRLCWSRRSDVSRFQRATRNHILHPGHQKSDFYESRFSMI